MRLFFASLLCCSSFISNAQPPVYPPEAQPFIIKGYDVLDYKAGDLNGDGKEDAILILKNPGEDSIVDDNVTRPFLILIRQADGKLKQVVKNENAIMCRQCGGVFGDPYEGVELFNKGFSLSFYGGSSWRWAYNYEFRWNAMKKNWFLHKETQTSFQSGDPEVTMKTAEIAAAELGEIPIDKFNTDPGYDGSKWKVKTVKIFFYDSPKLGSKPRKAYLLKGNIATCIRLLKNFIEVSFENTKGEITSGYILRKDLAPIK